MSRHLSHRMHVHSLMAWDGIDPDERYAAIIAIYAASSAPLTDRECKERLGLEDMNEVRPRISELINDHKKLVECGKVLDHKTGRPVRTCTNTRRLP